MEDKFADTISQFGFQAEVVTPGGRRFPPLCRHLTLIGSDLDKKKLLCRHFTLIGDRNGLCSGPVFTPRPTTMWFALVSKSWSPDTQIQWHAKAALRSTQIILGLIIPGMGLTTAHTVRIRGMESCLATLPGSGEFPSAHTRFVSTVCPTSAQ